MAYTKIWAIKNTLKRALDYIENPDKTAGQQLVSGYNVDPLTASIEFAMTTSLAKELKGDYSKTGGGNNLAYHMLQSFSPEDNVTPEQAHELGKQLADKFLDGKFEYVISTHVDKDHIHNHIIINATSFYDHKKLNTKPYKTASQIRAISDQLCAENELSIIEEPGNLGCSYIEYQQKKKGVNWRREIRKQLNYLLEISTTYDDFLCGTEALGLIVDDKGKHIKYKIEGQDNYARGYKLSDDNRYTKDEILNRVRSNQNTFQYLKNAIKEVATTSTDYNDFTEKLKGYNIQVKKKYGTVTYIIDDVNNTKVKETSLGAAYNTENIIKSMLEKQFDFIEVEWDIAAEYNQNQKNKTEVQSEDTRVILQMSNIKEMTKDGLLLQLPDKDGDIKRVFIDSRHVTFENDNYSVYIGEKFDYHLMGDGDRDVKGEYLIRTLEVLNGVLPKEINIEAPNIKALTSKGIMITLPGIENLYIENKYVTYDRVDKICTVKLYENWNYNFSNAKKKESIQGGELIQLLEAEAREHQKDPVSVGRRIESLQRRTKLENIQYLAGTLKRVREEQIQNLTDIDIKVEKLLEMEKEVQENIGKIENKNSQYSQAVKYLLTYNKYMPYKEEYNKTPFFKKKQYYAAHEGELKAYEHALKQLEKMGVDTNVDHEKVIGLMKNQEKEIKKLSERVKEIHNKIQSFREARQTITDIQKDRRENKKGKDEKEI